MLDGFISEYSMSGKTDCCYSRVYSTRCRFFYTRSLLLRRTSLFSE